MKKNIIKVIGTLVFLTLMFFNVQLIFNVDNNGEKVDLKFVQSEAYADMPVLGWWLVQYGWGCRCNEHPGSACFISDQCLCSWGNCECC